MTQFRENISLKSFNTFGIDVTARWFASFATSEELSALLVAQAFPRLLILGGGSNVLFRDNIDGLVLKNEIRGIELIREDAKYVYVRAGAGENWHGFVSYCLQRNWAGVENLSLIPGSVGAAPMQNIGAYGVEIKEVFYELEAWDLHESKIYTFSLNDCAFGYRESVFKRKLKDRFIILNVTFRLNKVAHFHTEYGAIREELEKMGVQQLSIQAISQAVIRIRSSKLPDPKQIGNAGSFFKNPTVTAARFAVLKAAFPGIPGYPAAAVPESLPEPSTELSSEPSGSQPGALSSSQPGSMSSQSSGSPQPVPGVAQSEPGSLQSQPGSPQPAPSATQPQPGTSQPQPTTVKLAAGWLIEQCGWKGYRRGDAGCHALQALVLVNYGQATGKEIYDLSEEILQSVKNKFGVELEREVNIIPQI